MRRRIEVFSAPSDAPRVRRINDLVGAVGAAVALLVVALVAWDGAAFDAGWAALVASLPGLVGWAAQVVYLAAVAYAVALLVVAVAVLARHRGELVRDLVAAAALAVAAVVALSRWFDHRWPDLALLQLDRTATTFPALFVAAAVAVHAAAAPHLVAPLRASAGRLVLAGAVASTVSGLTQPTDVLGAVLVGLLAAAVVRYALGTTAGLPSMERVRSGLAELGVAVGDLRLRDQQPTASTVLEATGPDGTPLLVRVLGRDAWAAGRWARRWRFAWYQDDGSQHASTRREQVEHEALAMVLGSRAGVRLPELVAVGASAEQDAFLVAGGAMTSLGELDPSDVSDDLVDGWWSELARLHGAGLDHGRLQASTVGVDAEGRPMLAGLVGATIGAGDQQRREDVVSLLVVLGLCVGDDRALASARRVLGDERLADALPVLQTAALSPPLRREARAAKVKMGARRTQVAAALGVEPPAVEKLQRVSLGQVAMAAFGVFAAYLIISQLADVGFATIADALGEASVPLLVAALLATQLTNATDAAAFVALSPKPVPIGITAVEQVAISFVNLAVPTAAGRVAVNARFFQKFGISPVASTSTSMIVSFVGFLAQIILLVATIVVGDHSIDLSSLQFGGGILKLTVLAVAVALAAVVVVLVVPALRRQAVTRLRTPWEQLRSAMDVLRQPRKVGRSLLGSFGTEVLYALGLVLCVRALGGSIELGEALFINIAVSVFAGATPVPGGIGVTEAGLTAGLVSVGVPSEVAVSSVLLYRMASYYLPPIWGWACLRWLTRHDYL